MTTEIVVVSDSHLGPGNPAADRNWQAVASYVATRRPALVVHLGDLTLDGTENADHFAHARRRLDELAVPWHAVPGNHDVGDSVVAGAEYSSAITADRRQGWIDEIGPDHWSVELDGWTILGLNAQLAGSGLAADRAQEDWLAEQIGRARRHGRALAVALHKPLEGPTAELASAPVHRFAPPALVDQLTAGSGPGPDLVLSGHVHQHRVLDLQGVRHVWTPSTWAALPDHHQPVLGFKRTGLVSVQLRPGHPIAQVELIEPPGLRQLTIGETTANPYRPE